MIGVRIAVQTKCLAQPLRQALHTAASLACDGVQIDLRQELPAADFSETGRRQLRKLLDDLNLRIGSVTFPTRRGFANAEQLDRRLEATVEAMRLASHLGVRVMVLDLGALPAEGTAGHSTILAAIESLAAHGNRLGVEIAAQCPGASPAELLGFISHFPEKALGVDLNPADQIRHGRQPREAAHALGNHIVHVFANDAVRGFGGDAAADVQLGRGSADMPELLGLLEEHGYRGWVTIERRSAQRPADEVADAVQFLRSL